MTLPGLLANTPSASSPFSTHSPSLFCDTSTSMLATQFILNAKLKHDTGLATKHSNVSHEFIHPTTINNTTKAEAVGRVADVSGEVKQHRGGGDAAAPVAGTRPVSVVPTYRSVLNVLSPNSAPCCSRPLSLQDLA